MADELRIKVNDRSEIRPSWDFLFLEIAQQMATMGTCHRRQVGCVLTDMHHNILSTGLNGPPSGWEHCRYSEEHKCPGALAPSGTMLDECYATHAEQNAIDRCVDKDAIHALYCTASPCIECVKRLLQTCCERVVFLQAYPDNKAMERWTKHSMWKRTRTGMISGHRTWEHYKMSNGVWSAEVVASSGLR